MGVIYVDKVDSNLIIKSEYDEDLIRYCKSANGKWHRDIKRWIVPMSVDTVRGLVADFNAVLSPTIISDLYYEFPEQYAETIREQAIAIIPDILNQHESFINLFRDFGKVLRPFQSEGIIHLSVLQGRAILADEMGLGKTIQALGFWHLHNFAHGKTLVVCPKNVKFNWEKEIKDCTTKIMNETQKCATHIFQISGQKPHKLPEAYFYIINYDILDYWLETLQEMDFDLMILDEAHYIKNSHTKRTKAAIFLGQSIENVLALTGTPVLNRIIELWPLLNMLKPKIFSNKKEFVQNFTYCNDDDIKNNKNLVTDLPDEVFEAGKNLEALSAILRKHVIVRRTKKEVLHDLPPKVRTIQYAELDEKNWKQYKQAEEEFYNELQKKGLTIGDFLAKTKNSDAYILALLEKARQLALFGKMKSVCEWIENFIESSENEKLVVFVHHRSAHLELCSKFNNICVGIKGGDTDKQRQDAVEQFQTDPSIRLAIISITAGAEGINLTAASNALIVETAWSPGKTEQAEDRIHRIGQKSDSVTVWHMVAANTIDEPIYSLLAKKTKLIEEALAQNERNNGLTINNLLEQLNDKLNILGLRVSFDSELLANFAGVKAQSSTVSYISKKPICLPDGSWMSLLEAANFAQSKGSKITKQNLWDDIRAGRFNEGSEVIWIPDELSHAKGYWRISEKAVLRRIAERAKGPGRRRSR